MSDAKPFSYYTNRLDKILSMKNEDSSDASIPLSIDSDNLDKFKKLNGITREKAIRITKKNQKYRNVEEIIQNRKNKNQRLTRRDLIQIIVAFDIRRVEVYKELQEKFPSFPDVKEFESLFGSFSSALSAAWSRDLSDIKADYYLDGNVLYSGNKGLKRHVIDLIIHFKIRNKIEYNKYRKNYKNIFPSIGEIDKMFGSFKRAKELAKLVIEDFLIERYVDFKNKTGKYPTRSQLKQLGLEALVTIMAIHESKAKFDKFVDGLIRLRADYEKRGRDQEEMPANDLQGIDQQKDGIPVDKVQELPVQHQE